MKKLLYLLFTLFPVSCSYITDLKRTGDIITIEYDWNGASQIEIWNPVRLIPVIDDNSKIKLIGMDFIVEDYEFVHSENKIAIEHKNPNRLRENNIADLYIYSPKIERITVNSPSKLYSNDTLYFDNLNIVINGSAAYTTVDLILKGNNLRYSAFGNKNKSQHTLSGEIKTTHFNLEGGTIINAFNLMIENLKIIHKSYANCSISVSKQLDVEIHSSGNVYYRGNPDIIFERKENNLMKSTGQIFNIK